MRAAFAVLLCALVAVPAAAAAQHPAYDARGRLIEAPFVPADRQSRLTEERATALAEAQPGVAAWLRRYPRASVVTEATYDAKGRVWTVKAWSGAAGQIAEAKVDDAAAAVTEAWTGPQVAWRMGRGYDGAFGGKRLESPWLWFGFCAVFLLGLADLRRPLSLRNLDLAMLLSFAVSLWFFDEGRIFTSVPLVYPGLAYLLARMLWIGLRGRPPRASRPVWPVWVLAAATVFVAGFRVGLNVEESNVIDVGYSGVIGAQRIASGQAPWGNFPTEGELKACGPADSAGEVRDRIQTNGRCESANDRGDTYGPTAYLAYLPGYGIFGWSGKWELGHGGAWPDLKAVHFTTVLFDLLGALGLALVGRRLGGARLAVTLAFAWVTYPFTLWAQMSNTNDLIPPVLLVFGFWLATSAPARGALAALGGLAKFGSLVVVPLWLTYPERRLRPALAAGAGFLLAALAALSPLLLEPHPLHAARVFWERTVGWQTGRHSPFSLWDWGQYHAAGVPGLHGVQLALEALLLAGALALAWWPRRKTPLRLAALTAALVIGFEACLTYWLYSYLPWFFPFAAIALLAAPGGTPPPSAAEEQRERDVRALVAAV